MGVRFGRSAVSHPEVAAAPEGHHLVSRKQLASAGEAAAVAVHRQTLTAQAGEAAAVAAHRQTSTTQAEAVAEVAVHRPTTQQNAPVGVVVGADLVRVLPKTQTLAGVEVAAEHHGQLLWAEVACRPQAAAAERS